jgi:hypothetical protein
MLFEASQGDFEFVGNLLGQKDFVQRVDGAHVPLRF